jgi:hypothetical protein
MADGRRETGKQQSITMTQGVPDNNENDNGAETAAA